jgi:hypothetical protein
MNHKFFWVWNLLTFARTNKSLDFEGVACDVGKTPKKVDLMGESRSVRKLIEERGQEICGVIKISPD